MNQNNNDFSDFSEDDLPKLDDLGHWSLIKLEIIKRYALEYSKILSRRNLHYAYIDAFSGAGIARSKESGELIPGSPQIALNIDPPFPHYYFIDNDKTKIEFLKNSIKDRNDVTIIEGDANKVLIQDIFPKFVYSSYSRALCIMDPYGLHLSWDVVKLAGELKTIEIFLNFPVLGMNRNVLHKSPSSRLKINEERMNIFWGDNSWNKIIYRQKLDFFDDTIEHKIATSDALVKEYRNRLSTIAGFKFVPKPIPMKDKDGHTFYYLYYASNNATGAKIGTYILKNINTILG